jgi:hypothetical protein
VENASAYYDTPKITAVKSFMAEFPGIVLIAKGFLLV